MASARRRLLASLGVTAVAVTAFGASMAVASDPPPTTIGSIDVDAATIPELQAAMEAGELTAVDLVRFYLDRIEVLDPQLNAVIAVSPTAEADAEAADAARAEGTDLPLLGIPVLLKDNIGAAGMPTTAGSFALAENMAPDAPFVTRLRDAGAIILGKANLSEWANMRAYPISSGWSAIGGQTNNPYALDRNPCGSSSGSAVAVAASLATVAVGTETDGSIVCPASLTGIVGVKPTLGLVSRTGVVPITARQDTAGPMARNVTDAAILLAAMAGSDPADAATADADSQLADYAAGLDPDALDGARIGVWRTGNFGINPPVDAIMEDTIGRLEDLGATIVDPTDLTLDAVYESEYPALLCEFKGDIASYLGTLDASMPKTLQDLIDFNLANAETELTYFQQETFDEAQAAPAIDDPACADARQTATSAAQSAIDEVMTANDLDAIIAPTMEPAWLTSLTSGDTFVGPYTAPAAAVAGYPSLTVPAGFVAGLPVGVSFIGPKWGDGELLSLAYALEQATAVRVPPTFLATVEDPSPIVTPAPAPVESPGADASPEAVASDAPAG